MSIAEDRKPIAGSPAKSPSRVLGLVSIILASVGLVVFVLGLLMLRPNAPPQRYDLILKLGALLFLVLPALTACFAAFVVGVVGCFREMHRACSIAGMIVAAIPLVIAGGAIVLAPHIVAAREGAGRKSIDPSRTLSHPRCARMGLDCATSKSDCSADCDVLSSTVSGSKPR